MTVLTFQTVLQQPAASPVLMTPFAPAPSSDPRLAAKSRDPCLKNIEKHGSRSNSPAKTLVEVTSKSVKRKHSNEEEDSAPRRKRLLPNPPILQSMVTGAPSLLDMRLPVPVPPKPQPAQAQAPTARKISVQDYRNRRRANEESQLKQQGLLKQNYGGFFQGGPVDPAAPNPAPAFAPVAFDIESALSKLLKAGVIKKPAVPDVQAAALTIQPAAAFPVVKLKGVDEAIPDLTHFQGEELKNRLVKALRRLKGSSCVPLSFNSYRWK